MAAPRILITGDYWHKDFQALLADLDVTTTMITLDKLSRTMSAPNTSHIPATYDLVAIAQSRQGQYDQSLIDPIVEHAGATPVVMLLGSWCEGERRSDKPIEGVKRVFWHQWKGRFETFMKDLNEKGISFWNSPATTTDADNVRAITFKSLKAESSHSFVIGVSAWNADAYQSLADACQSFGWQTRWVERSSWINLSSSVDALCVDAGSQTEKLPVRLSWLKEKITDVPIVLMANFPRSNEIAALERLGIDQVVSKPFELNDLRVAITAAIESGATMNGDAPTTPPIIPAPKMSRESKPTKQDRVV